MEAVGLGERGMMGSTCAEALVSRVLDDEGITAGLNDPEARVLIEWLVEQVERISAGEADPDAAGRRVEALCKRARLIRKFVTLWCHRQDHGAAAQFAATERLGWPLPTSDNLDPCEVMLPILACEKGL
jgi:hypothetical protein